ncbi:hypothetical protein ES703_96217 [subsurface metagenome]
MARVTYGESITEYAGSIGGVTFLRNASGPIAKLRSLPLVNPSPDQSIYQTNMAKLVAFWPTLSQANKDSWDALAAAHDHTTPWGETKTLSGFQWFISCNINRFIFAQGILSTAPAWAVPSVPNSFTIETSATYIRLAWSPDWTPATYWFLYATLPLRQSSIKLRRSLFYLRFVAPAGAMSNYDFTSEYIALANIVWATFEGSADCSIIARAKQVNPSNGFASPFTSAIVKID